MLSILFDIVVQPIIYVIELAFSIMYNLSGNIGVSIIGVSLVVNILCLPLYRMADEAQDRERKKQRSMERWVSHIKRHFKGDEQYMMLSTYYAEQGYRPINALVGSLPLLLQIPFFMAAYSYLSNLSLLQETPFLFLSNLGAPDALLNIGGLAINVMPIVMTAINCGSTYVYTRGLPLRDKLQAYLLAGLFLMLLYDSPSGLVFYWTCNQLFSLGKNVVMKHLSSKREASQPQQEPEATPAAQRAAATRERRATIVQFFLGAALLAVLMGLLVPAALVGDSPTEFVDVFDYVDPLSHVVHSFCVWFGLLVVWLGVYFLLSSQSARRKMALVMWCLCGMALVGYFAFKPEFGTITSELTYDGNVYLELPDIFLNLGVLVAVVAVLIVLWRKANRLVAPALGVLVIALVALSVPSLVDARGKIDSYVASKRETSNGLFAPDGTPKQILSLSREGTNVVVLFMDRALSGMLPYIFDERPELEAKYDGFTYYPNTLSFGPSTNFGTPGLYGGYEYTPERMNERNTEPLVKKHDEALLVMPTLFSKADYKTTVVNPPYAKYNYYSDLSLYDGMQNTSAYNLTGAYRNIVNKEYGIPPIINKRNFVYFGLFRVAPRLLQIPIYDGGNYNSPTGRFAPYPLFMEEWSALHMLPVISSTQETGNTFLVLGNAATHDPGFLNLPDYEPAAKIKKEITGPTVRVHDGKTMQVANNYQYTHYQANASMCLQLARWFDWMREQGVYDNTRIIIASDHGRDLKQFEGQTIDNYLDVEMVNPLFMVKDFDAHGFRTSNEFMTNADTPTLAMQGLFENPKNPFTGKPINSKLKSGEQVVTASGLWRTANGYRAVFDTSDAPWYTVHDNIFDLRNWRRLD